MHFFLYIFSTGKRSLKGGFYRPIKTLTPNLLSNKGHNQNIKINKRNNKIIPFLAKMFFVIFLQTQFFLQPKIHR